MGRKLSACTKAHDGEGEEQDGGHHHSRLKGKWGEGGLAPAQVAWGAQEMGLLLSSLGITRISLAVYFLI